jgi:hypothetical protein
VINNLFFCLLQQCDTRIAAANAGLDLRPLIISEIQGTTPRHTVSLFLSISLPVSSLSLSLYLSLPSRTIYCHYPPSTLSSPYLEFLSYLTLTLCSPPLLFVPFRSLGRLQPRGRVRNSRKHQENVWWTEGAWSASDLSLPLPLSATSVSML